MPLQDVLANRQQPLVPGNIDLSVRPRVRNGDGSVSTVRSISINEDGKEVLIPTVSDDGRVLSNDAAVALYQRTGRHLGKFADESAATTYAQQLHEQQAATLTSPAISPFYRHYMLKQADAIRQAGGGDEDVKQYYQIALRKPVMALPPVTVDARELDRTPDNLRGISMALVQGATFGFGDEAVGSMLGLVTGVGARGGIDQYRREYADWYAQHRKTGFATEIVGGVGGTALALAALPAGAVAALATKPAGILSASARGAGVGAAAGAVSGAGGVNSDDLSFDMLGDRMRGAVLGAGVGATLGAGLGAAGRLVQPIVSTAIDKLGQTTTVQRVAEAVKDFPIIGELHNITPEGRAIELLSKWAQTRSLDAPTLLQRAQGFWSQGQRPTIVDAMGPEFAEFARGVLKEQTAPVRAAMEALTTRQIGSGDRLVGQLLLRSLDNPKLGTTNVYTAARDLQNKARADAAPLYAEAHDAVVQVTPELRRALAHPDIRAAWNAGAGVANGEVEVGIAKGLTVPMLDNTANAAQKLTASLRARGTDETRIAELVKATFPNSLPDELPVRGFDYMQRSAHEPINARLQRLAARPSPQTQQLLDRELATMDARVKPLIDEARTQVPVFGQALDAYSGPMKSRAAFLRGYNDFKKSVLPAEVASRLSAMAPSDRDFYRLGTIRFYREKLGKDASPLRNVAAQQFGGALLRFGPNGQLRGRLNDDAARAVALFPGNAKGAQDFIRFIAGEADLSKTVDRTLSLPKQVSTEKLIESNVGQVPQARGTLGTTVASAGRQGLMQERLNLARADNQALAELFGHGLRNPDDLRTLIEEMGFQAAQNPWNVGRRAGTALTQKVARTATTALVRATPTP